MVDVLFITNGFFFFLDMEATYAEYEEWSDNAPPKETVHQYKSALQQREKYKPFEESLVSNHQWGFGLADFEQRTLVYSAVPLQLVAETPKLAEYQAYIDFEMKEGDPARIQMTFERTLVDNCLVPDMWTKYATYLVSIDLV